MKTLILVAFLAFISSNAAAFEDGCKYDTQCKNERVCKSGQCVDSGTSDIGESHEDTFPPGTIVKQCGCWGPVAPGQVFRSDVCQGGREQANVCQAYCPMGGYAWGTRCM
jgi:hypothetical protein